MPTYVRASHLMVSPTSILTLSHLLQVYFVRVPTGMVYLRIAPRAHSQLVRLVHWPCPTGMEPRTRTRFCTAAQRNVLRRRRQRRHAKAAQMARQYTTVGTYHAGSWIKTMSPVAVAFSVSCVVVDKCTDLSVAS